MAARLGQHVAQLAALGHPIRLTTLRYVASEDPAGTAVHQSLNRLDISGSTLSHHIERLASAGLLNACREGISSSTASAIRLSLDVLAGVPSIVWGLFGNAFFCVFFGFGFSILSGALTLACMILPIFVRTCERGLQAVGDEWRPAGAALGMPRTTIIWHVLLPAAAPAIVAGLMLGIGRATAETAALIFTSGYVERMPESLGDSGRALAVHIYDLSMNVGGGDDAAYASALVLVALIIVINLIAVALSDRWFARRITIV